jgi:hypothetical protein
MGELMDADQVVVLNSWRRLGCAVLLRAWRDAHNRNGHKAAREIGLPVGVTLAGDARAFLESDGALWLAALLELDAGIVDDIRAELAPAEWRQLALVLKGV